MVLGELAERRRAMPPVEVAHHPSGGVVQSCKQQCRFVGGVILRPVLHVPGAKGGVRYTAWARAFSSMHCPKAQCGRYRYKRRNSELGLTDCSGRCNR
jgi:hypothetical protein